MQPYDINIAPNQPRRINAEGRYLYYYAGSAGGADPTLSIKGVDSGYRALLLPGQGLRLPQDVRETNWLLSNYTGGAAIIGTVQIGAGEIQDNRSTGVVEVIDGGKNRTLANAAFLNFATALSGTAQFAVAQLWNPGTSAKRVVVSQARVVVSTTAGFVNMGYMNAQLPNAGTAAWSKLVGASPVQSTAVTAKENNGVTDRLVGTAFDSVYVPVGQQVTYSFKEPMVLMPGYGLTLQAGASTTLNASFEFTEEPVT